MTREHARRQKNRYALQRAGFREPLGLLGNSIWSRRQESNLDLSLRRAEFYPLKYSEKARNSNGF